jgi:hypothetical protein
MRASRLLLAAVLISPALAGVAVAADSTSTRSLKQSFPAGSEVRLANLAGTVSIVAGKGSQVQVEATIHARGDSDGETQKLLQGMSWVEARDKKGRSEMALSYPVDDYDTFAYPDERNSSWWEGNSRTQVHYLGERVNIVSSTRRAPVLYADLRIELPAAVRFAVRLGAGSVDSGKTSGGLEIDTGSGDVTVDVHDGKLLVDTGSGNVEVGEAREDVTIDTGSGDVRVMRMAGRGLVDTGSGNVEVDQFQGTALSIDTGSGDVRVGDGSTGTLDVDTGSGDIRVEGLEMEVFHGDTGSGDVVVKTALIKTRDMLVDTGSGSVKILGGADASFDLEAEQGSGELVVGYSDAQYKVRRGREVYGATRGDRRTKIRVDTGSGDCVLQPSSM